MLLVIGAVVAYNNHARAMDRRDTRAFFCHEIERLKAQNRDEVAEDKKNFPRTLRLLKLKPTPEIRRVAEEGWKRRLARNKPDLKRCLTV